MPMKLKNYYKKQAILIFAPYIVKYPKSVRKHNTLVITQLINTEKLFFNIGITCMSHCVLWHWALCHIGHYGIGYYVKLGIMALGIMTLGIMSWHHRIQSEFFGLTKISTVIVGLFSKITKAPTESQIF